MARLIVSTCGTSLLTNNAGDKGALLRETASLKAAELGVEQRRELDRHIAARAALLAGSSVPLAARELCAELRALITNGDLDRGRGSGDHHVLVCGDTYQGMRTAELLEEWLRQRCSVELLAVPGLVPTDLVNFRSALTDLARACLELIEQHRAAKRTVTFNLNGGFKAVQGFMQTLGCHCADECIYIFETGREIMRIPRLPMTLDPEGVIGRNLPAIRAMAIGDELTPAEVQTIPETLLLELDGKVLLSEWGEIMWRSCRERYYQQRLLPPPSGAVAYSGRFERDVRQLPADRLAQLNRQIDALAACVAAHGRHNPRSLSFKPLKGNPVEGATHQFYAWSDRDAARGWGYFAPGGTPFVIDRLDSHL